MNSILCEVELKKIYIRKDALLNFTLKVKDDEGSVDDYGFEVAISRKPQSYYYLKDHLGNIRVTVDEQGDAVAWNDYYPFGLQMPGRSLNNALSNNIYKFSGKELDEEGGLNWYHFGARPYDPESGRWLSVDPMALSFPDQTPYQYTHNNPINRFDPDGRADFGSAERLDKVARSIMNDPKYKKVPKTTTFDIKSKYLSEYDAYEGVGYWETYCNFAARDILLAGGDQSLVDMTASEIFNKSTSEFMLQNPSFAMEITYEEAVNYAKEGITAILSSRGHVAIVAPEMGYSESLKMDVPKVYNVGKTNAHLNASRAFDLADMPRAYVLVKDLKSSSSSSETGSVYTQIMRDLLGID